MSEQPETASSAASRWQRWAEEDLALAEHVAAAPDVVRRGVCTWAQQAAEKAIKALLVAADVDPPKSHDLSRLAALLPDRQRAGLPSVDLAELTR